MQLRVRDAIEQDYPPRLPPSFPSPGVGDVHRFVAAVTPVTLRGDGDGACAGVIREDAVAASRRIFSAGERRKQGGADGNPRDVENGEASIHGVSVAWRATAIACGSRAVTEDVERVAAFHLSRALTRDIFFALMTRDEIARKLVDIVRKEKDLPDEMLAPETNLADAGIDSLDSLTILFGIEEEFKISIPDNRARAIRTFGDMVNVVADELRIEN